MIHKLMLVSSISTHATIIGPTIVRSHIPMDVHIQFYPPNPESFKLDDFYWPSPDSTFGAAISRLLPHYPACLDRTAEDTAVSFGQRILSYHFWIDRFVYRMEDNWRRKMKIKGISRLNQEKILGM
jgi:hypothetical protein